MPTPHHVHPAVAALGGAVLAAAGAALLAVPATAAPTARGPTAPEPYWTCDDLAHVRLAVVGTGHCTGDGPGLSGSGYLAVRHSRVAYHCTSVTAASRGVALAGIGCHSTRPSR